MKILLLFSFLLLFSCSSFNSIDTYHLISDDKNDLELPPSLSQPKNINDTNIKQQLPANTTTQQNVKIKQYGAQYWLEIDNISVDQTWLKILSYMKETGLKIKNNDVSKGFIQTDWVSMDTETPKGSLVRDLFSGIGLKDMYTLDRAYSFNFMVMPSLEKANKVLLMVTVYQLNEVFDGCLNNQQITTTNFKAATSNQRTTWFALPPNPQLTVEILNNILIYLGGKNNYNKPSKIKPLPIKNQKIHIADDYQTVWVRTAVALPAIGLTIKSYNLSQGEFLVFPTTKESLSVGSQDLAGYIMTKLDNKPKALPKACYKVSLNSPAFSNSVILKIESLSTNSNSDQSNLYLNKLAIELYKN